jgi:hypothetical protein
VFVDCASHYGRANRSTARKEGVTGMTNMTLSLRAPTYASNQKIRYCKYCATPIRWEYYEHEKIINAASIYHFQIIRTKNWVPIDCSTGKKHVCVMTKEEVVA